MIGRSPTRCPAGPAGLATGHKLYKRSKDFPRLSWKFFHECFNIRRSCFLLLLGLAFCSNSIFDPNANNYHPHHRFLFFASLCQLQSEARHTTISFSFISFLVSVLSSKCKQNLTPRHSLFSDLSSDRLAFYLLSLTFLIFLLSGCLTDPAFAMRSGILSRENQPCRCVHFFTSMSFDLSMGIHTF